MIVKFVLIHAILSLGLCKVINNELEDFIRVIELEFQNKQILVRFCVNRGSCKFKYKRTICMKLNDNINK